MRLLGIIAAVVLMIALAIAPSPAHADDTCVITTMGIKVCGEAFTPLPTITVAPEPIIIPGPAETVTIYPPQATVTTSVLPQPGSTTTVTEPGSTTTVTDPAPVGQSDSPTETVTETATVSENATATGQDPPDHDRVDPDDSTSFVPDSVIEYVGVGLLSILVLLFMILVGSLYGFYRGKKFSEGQEKKFLDNLLNMAVSRDTHR